MLFPYPQRKTDNGSLDLNSTSIKRDDGVMLKGGGGGGGRTPIPRISKFYRRDKKLFWSVSIQITATKFQYAIECDEKFRFIPILFSE